MKLEIDFSSYLDSEIFIDKTASKWKIMAYSQQNIIGTKHKYTILDNIVIL